MDFFAIAMSIVFVAFLIFAHCAVWYAYRIQFNDPGSQERKRASIILDVGVILFVIACVAAILIYFCNL